MHHKNVPCSVIVLISQAAVKVHLMRFIPDLTTPPQALYFLVLAFGFLANNPLFVFRLLLLCFKISQNYKDSQKEMFFILFVTCRVCATKIAKHNPKHTTTETSHKQIATYLHGLYSVGRVGYRRP